MGVQTSFKVIESGSAINFEEQLNKAAEEEGWSLFTWHVTRSSGVSDLYVAVMIRPK